MNLASIFDSTTCWSSTALVSRNHTCIFTLNTSIKWCLWQAFSNNWQNLEETSTNVLGPIIYRVRWLKHQFFLMLGIAKLRSIQYQDADNRISNPTDLAAKLPSNLILIMSDMVSKRWRAGICKDCSLQIQKAQMLCSLHIHLSCPAVLHWTRFRPCELIPNACHHQTFQICMWNQAHLCGQRCTVCDSTEFYEVAFPHLQTGTGAGPSRPDKIQSVLLFLKTLNPFQVSKCLIYARSAPLSGTS